MDQWGGRQGWTWLALLAAVGALMCLAGAALAEDPLTALAARAAGGDLDAARALHAAGPRGLSALLDTGVLDPSRDPTAPPIRALDIACGQVECASSRLYWYTDGEAARPAAAASGRPILVLRLLGRLDEQLSCANSRYFR